MTGAVCVCCYISNGTMQFRMLTKVFLSCLASFELFVCPSIERMVEKKQRCQLDVRKVSMAKYWTRTDDQSIIGLEHAVGREYRICCFQMLLSNERVDVTCECDCMHSKLVQRVNVKTFYSYRKCSCYSEWNSCTFHQFGCNLCYFMWCIICLAAYTEMYYITWILTSVWTHCELCRLVWCVLLSTAENISQQFESCWHLTQNTNTNTKSGCSRKV